MLHLHSARDRQTKTLHKYSISAYAPYLLSFSSPLIVYPPTSSPRSSVPRSALPNLCSQIVISYIPIPKLVTFLHRNPQLRRLSGTARANLAPSAQSPHGTTTASWASHHSHQTVLQQHCAFFDPDNDGIIYPLDTFHGFYKLGYGMLLSLLAVLIIHANLSYPTSPSWLPDPFFRIYLADIHRDKHGSDTGTYDNEGRYVPQKFEDIFTKYAEGREYLTLRDVGNVIMGQRCISDPIGWGG
ncbi:Caleosin-domain-containing protein [Melanomma pulvis-pyrius CBS 109.77]|uniref:Caleosin-domain-containing protein n=1 Tax=Melanomma pulvis-pyrius CBS 109.77 TaxID=1314802 RepID=A0A6A6XD88_9PLEO|nr:Caleosin-domain-containing protein [Melanomma pulvis-pyrius CBS 109.77]